MELNKIYNEDCLQGMKRIKDKSVDMILCDLPYQSTANKWDKRINQVDLWEQYKRVLKTDGVVVLTADIRFAVDLIQSSTIPFRYDLIWEKTTPTGHLNANRMPLRNHELILVFYNQSRVYNPQKTEGHTRKISLANHKKNATKTENYRDYEFVSYDSTERYPKSVWKFATDKQKTAIHPTQKPVLLFEELIKSYTNKNDVVLDNCMGSGTTAVACMNTDRNFIGFEKEKEYFDKANVRIEQNIHQLELI